MVRIWMAVAALLAAAASGSCGEERRPEGPAFLYYDGYYESSRWRADAERVAASTEFVSWDFPGFIGPLGFGGQGSFVYQFDFPAPVETLILEDRHNTHPSYLEEQGLADRYRGQDTTNRVSMWTSADGVSWRLRYADVDQQWQETRLDLSAEFEGQQRLFVKYTFYNGNPMRGPTDPRGASLDWFKLTGTLQSVPPAGDTRSYKIQVQRPGDPVLLPLRALPARLIQQNKMGILWWADAQRRFGPWDRLDPTAVPHEPVVRVTLAANEAEAVQVVFEPDPAQSLRQVRLVEVPELRPWWRRWRQPAPAPEIHVHRLGALQPDPGDINPRPLRYNYLLLDQTDDRDDTPRQAPFWVTVRAPRGTAPGHYRRTLKLFAADVCMAEIKLEVEVFGFELPLQSDTRTALFVVSGGNLEILGTKPWDEGYDEFVTREAFEVLADHRIAAGHSMPLRWRDFGNYRTDHNLPPLPCTTPEVLAEYKHWVKWWHARGLHATTVPYGDGLAYGQRGTPETRRKAVADMQAFLPVLRELGIEQEVYYRTYDEPFKRYRQGVPWVERQGRLAKEHFGSVPVYLSYGHLDMGTFQRLDPVVDIWAGMIASKSDNEALDFLERKAAEGKQVWPYIHGDLGPSFALRTRNFFWFLHSRGFNGVSLWSVNAWNRSDPPLRREGNAWAGYSTLFWPGDRHLVPCLALEHIRDGIEDREYLLLHDARYGKDATRRLIERVVRDYYDRARDPDVLRDVRRELATRLSREASSTNNRARDDGGSTQETSRT